MLNAEKSTVELLRHAAYIEGLDPEVYDQDTPNGCICGHYARLHDMRCHDQYGVGKAMGLSYTTASKLFAPIMVDGKAPTVTDAARVLRELAVTGEVPAWWARAK